MWAGLVVVARVWGLWYVARGRDFGLGGVPLFGEWTVRSGWRVLPSVVAAALVVVLAVPVVERLAWRAVLVATGATAVAWAVALAWIDGPDGLTQGLVARTQYLPFARGLDDIPAFVRTFTEQVQTYPTHVKSHPPGMVVLLALLDRFGLGGDRWIAALVIAGGAVAAVAALVLARQVAGEVVARRAAPFVATMPAAIWIASSADALFAGVVLTGVALVALACARRDRMGDAQALLGGVLLGVALHLSYGLVLVGPLVLAVAVASRGPRVRSLAIAVIGASAVTAAFLAAGFAWWRGLLATHDAYYAGIASHRPYSYFVVANLAALAFAVGPVVAVGVARLRGALWWLVGPVLAAVAIADLSGMSKAEVERIWLFLAIPLGVATASLPAGARGRGLLAVQCAAGIVLAVTFAAGW